MVALSALAASCALAMPFMQDDLTRRQQQQQRQQQQREQQDQRRRHDRQLPEHLQHDAVYARAHSAWINGEILN